MMNDSSITKGARYLRQKLRELDSKTIKSGLEGWPLMRELLTRAAWRFVVAKGKIAAIEGFLSPGQEYFLTKKAADLPNGATIVEIGSFKGKSTACLALGCVGSHKQIYAIDTFKGNDEDFVNHKTGQPYRRSFFPQFKKNITQLGLWPYIHPVVGKSQQVGQDWTLPIDLLFIDGSHLYANVRQDFNLFYPHVKPGGLIMLHDVLLEFPGVLKVWEKIVQPKLHRTNCFLSIGYGYK